MDVQGDLGNSPEKAVAFENQGLCSFFVDEIMIGYTECLFIRGKKSFDQGRSYG